MNCPFPVLATATVAAVVVVMMMMMIVIMMMAKALEKQFGGVARQWAMAKPSCDACLLAVLSHAGNRFTAFDAISKKTRDNCCLCVRIFDSSVTR